jgi:ribosomal protein S27AE
MVRRSETCPNCGHSFGYNAATGTGPTEFLNEGQCPDCGHHVRTPPGT